MGHLCKGKFFKSRFSVFCWRFACKPFFNFKSFVIIFCLIVSFFLKMILFQCMLLLHLSYQLENRLFEVRKNSADNRNRTLLANNKTSLNDLIKSLFDLINYLINNMSFIILILNCFSQIWDLYLCYSIISVLICPLKTWSLILALYLRFKCKKLTMNEFRKFASIRNYSNDKGDNRKNQNHLN